MKTISHIVIALWIFFSPTILAAQTSSVTEDDDTICLPTLRVWRGSPEETLQIHETPVPESYRTASGGGCGGPALAEFLVVWHLRFGDERSIEEALRYIDRRDGEVTETAARIDRDLAAALAGLAREIKHTRAAHDAKIRREGSDSAAIEKAFEQRMNALLTAGESVGRISQLKDDLQRKLLERTNLYLSAAEIFRSPSLTEKSRNAFALHQTIEAKMLPKRDGGNTQNDSDLQKALAYVQDSSIPYLTSMEIDLRLAVLQAQLSRSPETFSDVRTALERRYKPVYANAPKVAFEGGDDFCDLREDLFLNAWERDIAAACKGDDPFVQKAMAYGYAEGMLAILTDSQPEYRFGHWNWDEFVTLVKKDAIRGSIYRDFLLGPEDRVISLKLELADRQFLNAKAKAGGHWSFEEAWQNLVELSPMVNPAQNPVRFRQIAERAIAVADEMEKQDEGWKRETAPMLAYFRLNLRNLDKLATGRVP